MLLPWHKTSLGSLFKWHQVDTSAAREECNDFSNQPSRHRIHELSRTSVVHQSLVTSTARPIYSSWNSCHYLGLTKYSDTPNLWEAMVQHTVLHRHFRKRHLTTSLPLLIPSMWVDSKVTKPSFHNSVYSLALPRIQKHLLKTDASIESSSLSFCYPRKIYSWCSLISIYILETVVRTNASHM